MAQKSAGALIESFHHRITDLYSRYQNSKHDQLSSYECNDFIEEGEPIMKLSLKKMKIIMKAGIKHGTLCSEASEISTSFTVIHRESN